MGWLVQVLVLPGSPYRNKRQSSSFALLLAFYPPHRLCNLTAGYELHQHGQLPTILVCSRVRSACKQGSGTMPGRGTERMFRLLLTLKRGECFRSPARLPVRCACSTLQDGGKRGVRQANVAQKATFVGPSSLVFSFAVRAFFFCANISRHSGPERKYSLKHELHEIHSRPGDAYVTTT